MTISVEMEPWELLTRAFYLQQCLIFGKLTDEQRQDVLREIRELEAAMREIDR